MWQSGPFPLTLFQRFFGVDRLVCGTQDVHRDKKTATCNNERKVRSILLFDPMTVSQDRYWLVARDKPGLLTHMMRFLAGDAHICFEGNLSRCGFPASIPRLAEGKSVLRRQTVSPQLDFATLALEPDTLRPILDVVLPANRYMDDIIHIQIEKHRELQFGSYDQFHHECIVCFHGVPTEFLDELKQKGILRAWTIPNEDATRRHG